MNALHTLASMPTGGDAEGEAMVARLSSLPEADALSYYASLSSHWQWFVRQRLTGVRRLALIRHHALAIAGCK